MAATHPVKCMCGRDMLDGPTGFLVCRHCDAPHEPGHGTLTCQSCRVLDAAVKRRYRTA